MSSQPVIWDAKCYPEEGWSRTFIIKNTDLSGALWLMQVRRARGAPLVAEASTANGRVIATYDGTDTTVVLRLPASITKALKPQMANYSISVDDGVDPDYYVTGEFEIVNVVNQT